MIRLNVFIQVSEANRAQVLDAAKDLVAQSLKDNGCVAYDIFESATRPDVLMICETWKDQACLDVHQAAPKDQACLDVHQAAPHFTTLVPKIQELAEMKIESFEF